MSLDNKLSFSGYQLTVTDMSQNAAFSRYIMRNNGLPSGPQVVPRVFAGPPAKLAATGHLKTLFGNFGFPFPPLLGSCNLQSGLRRHHREPATEELDITLIDEISLLPYQGLELRIKLVGRDGGEPLIQNLSHLAPERVSFLFTVITVMLGKSAEMQREVLPTSFLYEQRGLGQQILGERI